MTNKNSKDLLKELYAREYKFSSANDKEFEMPIKGSLSILALGYEGLIAWRKQKHILSKSKATTK